MIIMVFKRYINDLNRSSNKADDPMRQSEKDDVVVITTNLSAFLNTTVI